MAGTRGDTDQADRAGHVGGPGRIVALAVSVALAMFATGMLVLSDDPKVLRLAIVATLWAFLVATFAATRRHPADDEETPGADLELRRAYEVELEREVAARREYELRLEVQLRREMDETIARDVQALRQELLTLHQEIAARLEGVDVKELPSRSALRAQSTRLPGLTGSGSGALELHDESRRLATASQAPRADNRELPAGLAAVLGLIGEPDKPAELVLNGAEVADPPEQRPHAHSEAPEPPAAPEPHDAGPDGDTGTGGEATAGRVRRYRDDVEDDTLTRLLADQAKQAGQAAHAGHAGQTNGSEPGKPRRRRYREDGEDNEVLARVLGEATVNGSHGSVGLNGADVNGTNGANGSLVNVSDDKEHRTEDRDEVGQQGAGQ